MIYLKNQLYLLCNIQARDTLPRVYGPNNTAVTLVILGPHLMGVVVRPITLHGKKKNFDYETTTTNASVSGSGEKLLLGQWTLMVFKIT